MGWNGIVEETYRTWVRGRYRGRYCFGAIRARALVRIIGMQAQVPVRLRS